ncbi:hypothetical protein SDC9_126238 [bioreactor metagenome]|uniref:Uncharacterized protein n=1 Tax=bioreactor metagenome TaxID=1076179 RepID=A0A645CQM6_9ZZZZ
MLYGDPNLGSLGDDIDTGSEKKKLPPVFGLPCLDHLLHLGMGVLCAGIFLAIGDDGHQDFLSFFLRGIVCQRPSDCIEEGGGSSHLIGFFGKVLYVVDINPVVKELVAVAEQDGGEKTSRAHCLLLGKQGIEAPNGILFQPVHRTTLVENENQLR